MSGSGIPCRTHPSFFCLLKKSLFSFAGIRAEQEEKLQHLRDRVTAGSYKTPNVTGKRASRDKLVKVLQVPYVAKFTFPNVS